MDTIYCHPRRWHPGMREQPLPPGLHRYPGMPVPADPPPEDPQKYSHPRGNRFTADPTRRFLSRRQEAALHRALLAAGKLREASAALGLARASLSARFSDHRSWPRKDLTRLGEYLAIPDMEAWLVAHE